MNYATSVDKLEEKEGSLWLTYGVNGNHEKERMSDGKGGNSAWNDREMEKKGRLSVELTRMPAIELVMSVWVGFNFGTSNILVPLRPMTNWHDLTR
jgi:hypothetical protein